MRGRTLELWHITTTYLSSVTSDLVECLTCGEENDELCPPQGAIPSKAFSMQTQQETTKMYERFSRKIQNNRYITNRMGSVVKVTHKAASSSSTPTRSDKLFVLRYPECLMKEKRKKLRLRIDKTIDIETRKTLKQERDRLQQPSNEKHWKRICQTGPASRRSRTTSRRC